MADEKKKRNKKKKRGGSSKKKISTEQTEAFKSVTDWVFVGSSPPLSSSSSLDHFAVTIDTGSLRCGEKLVFELHSHSNRSDGFLSPSKLVERAHNNGVKVLSLTDHDTMAGIPEAVEAGRRFGIKIIPGIEISTLFCSRESGSEEPVHILAYYGTSGPAMYGELEGLLVKIRDGRVVRGREMVSKLNKLKIPLKWEHVTRIAGKDAAPGRLHVARALLEAGYVENLRQAFTKYLYDGGPAYCTGSEPMSEEAVKLICKTGGVAVLAHPWALKDHVSVIRRLKDAGLHGVEVYRSDGKQEVFSELADTYSLLKLGGSDYHGKGGRNESELGSVNLPVMALQEFLKVGRPIWCEAIKATMRTFLDQPCDSNLSNILRFDRTRILKGSSVWSCGKELMDRCLAIWLTSDESQSDEFEDLRLKLSFVSITSKGSLVTVGS
uniref:PHP domain-containing protein n=1 Tax=Noccaea caerulescens TaxID=107243 RepID=A0A1J3FQW5_NOCCA